jgi:hypothetical protein
MLTFGGYFMSFDTTRQVVKRLGITEVDHYKNMEIEWPINDWLDENQIHHIKAAVVKWPKDDGSLGVIFISRFAEAERDNYVLEEGDKDLKVRKWLEELEAKDLQWVSMADRFVITLGGLKPRKNGKRFKEVSQDEFWAIFQRSHPTR